MVTPAKASENNDIYKCSSRTLYPQVTLNVLKEAKELGVPALWIQPGAEGPEIADYIKENGLENRVVYGGPCLLVQGDGIRQKL